VAIVLLLAAFTIVAIALYDAYGPRQGMTVHYSLSAVFAAFFFAATLLLGEALESLSSWVAEVSRAVAGLFLVGAVPFYWVPNDWDGIYERVLVVLVVGWLAMLSIVRLRRPRSDA
jgi:hypothetical protein